MGYWKDLGVGGGRNIDQTWLSGQKPIDLPIKRLEDRKGGG